MSDTVCAIFTGGLSTRMGGVPKGDLTAPDGSGMTLVERLESEAIVAGLEVVRVGRGGEAVLDAPGVTGPLAGLVAALGYAGDRRLITVACDMPYVTAADLVSLADDPRDALILCARRDDTAPWEPFLARWDSARVYPTVTERVRRGERSFQRLIDGIGAERWSPVSPYALDDWDTPEDINRPR